ncbi:MAG: VanW family protein [Microthrixaceae bacterium]
MSKVQKILLLVVATPLVLIALVAAAWGLDHNLTGDKVARNVSVAGAEVGGFTPTELDAELQTLAQQVPDTEVKIQSGSHTMTTTAGDLGLSMDVDSTATEINNIGRLDPLPTRPVRWLRGLFGGRSADIALSVDSEKLTPTLVALQGERRSLPVEPNIAATEEAVTLVPGSPGTEITMKDVVNALPQSIADLTQPINIMVEPTVTQPLVTDASVQALVDQANATTSGQINLDAGGTKIEVEGKVFRPAFILMIEGTTSKLAMKPESVSLILESQNPSQPNPTNVRFDIIDGLPTPVGGEDAQICCTPEAPQRIVDGLLAGQTTINLPTRVVTAQEGRDWAAGLGVKEVIGSFTTKHKCCESRVTNIHKIADILRGTLIPPGATFSVNDTVGKRTSAKGFVEGGVIQDGEFATDIGGGVSQFATTAFNAAFFGGLDIPAYKAHSKYISRYPFGREATLAYPSVDLKIRNETPYGVVIWPSYSSTALTVSLWSTPFAKGEQTAQNQSSGCGSVSTERTRTFVDGHTEKDTFRAKYDCD